MSCRAALRAASLLLALPLLALARPGRAAVCPATSLDLGGYGTLFTNTARGDTSSTYGGNYHVAWDLGTGQLVMNQFDNLSSTFIHTQDAYDLAGVPAGTAVTVTARFTVDSDVYTPGCGGTGCSGTVGMVIDHGGQTVEQVHSVSLFNGEQTFHDVLELPVTIIAGQPETIGFEIYGHRNPGGNHGSDGTGTIDFAGLPAGASVTSCQGFGSLATPARASTWGRLKAAYR